MNTQTKIAIFAIVVVIPLSSVAVFGTDSDQQASKFDNENLQVISSVYPLHDFAKNIGKEKVDAILLVPMGVEPHDWEPTIKDVQRMQTTDLILINGLGFENWASKLNDTQHNGKIIDTSDGILGIIGEDEKGHDHELGDPHIWLNPKYAKIQVQNIAKAFSKTDPKNEEFYRSNSVTYIEKLESLDLKIKNQLSKCNSDFIAFHDAFSYFAEEYNLNQHSIVSSKDSHGEITAKTLENVISLAKQLDIKIIFSEETIDSRTSEIIANEIGGKVLVLSPLEVGSKEGYISKMTENLENLKAALC